MASAAEPARVAIVLPSVEAYRESVGEINELLSRKGHVCKVIQFPAPRTESTPSGATTAATVASGGEGAAFTIDLSQVTQQLRDFRPTLIVAAGSNATLLVLRLVADVPVISCAVPNALDRPFLAADSPLRSRVAAVTTDVPPATQVEWIHQSSPKTKRLGILCSDNSQHTAEAMTKPAQEKGITVCVIRAEREAFPNALRELNDRGCDGALMIADANVYNAPNAQALLLWGLRGRKPVWAFSSSLAKSGGFAALSADPRDLSLQVAGLVDKIVQGEQPGKLGLQYPRIMQRAVNEQTAELIGIELGKSVLESVKRVGRE